MSQFLSLYLAIRFKNATPAFGFLQTWDTNRSIYDILHDVSNKCEGKAELTKNGKDNPFQVFSFKYKLDHVSLFTMIG